ELLNRAPGVSESNVYGVRIPGADGRAGMAAIVLAPGATFDPSAFYAHTDELPSYARPLFLRLGEHMDGTGTVSQRKIELQVERYAPDRVREPLYFRDAAARCYVPLTRVLLARINDGLLRP